MRYGKVTYWVEQSVGGWWAVVQHDDDAYWSWREPSLFGLWFAKMRARRMARKIHETREMYPHSKISNW